MTFNKVFIYYGKVFIYGKGHRHYFGLSNVGSKQEQKQGEAQKKSQ